LRKDFVFAQKLRKSVAVGNGPTQWLACEDKEISAGWRELVDPSTMVVESRDS
jgi:hypothetical protein